MTENVAGQKWLQSISLLVNLKLNDNLIASVTAFQLRHLLNDESNLLILVL